MRELLPPQSLSRRFRILRHRTLRWFQPPISAVVRDRLGVERDTQRDG